MEPFDSYYQGISLDGALTNPIFTPKKHTVESYRSQQRKAKQRRKSLKLQKH